jgi:hypothetical protein
MAEPELPSTPDAAERKPSFIKLPTQSSAGFGRSARGKCCHTISLRSPRFTNTLPDGARMGTRSVCTMLCDANFIEPFLDFPLLMGAAILHLLLKGRFISATQNTRPRK